MRRFIRDQLRMKERLAAQDMLVEHVIEEIINHPTIYLFAGKVIDNPAFAESCEKAFVVMMTDTRYPSPREVAHVIDRMAAEAASATHEQLDVVKF